MADLKAYVRYAKNKAVAGSLILGRKPPKVGVWKEVPYDLCCDNLCPPCPVFCMENWTFENFDGTTYRNGDPIPEVTDSAAWGNLTTGAWCYYDNDPANGPIYGKLYNWYAVNDPRGLAPIGYRVPTVEDWDALAECLGGASIAGLPMRMTGNVGDDTGYWSDNSTPPFPFIPGTNTSGFSGLPGGARNHWYQPPPSSGAYFFNINEIGQWWSATNLTPDNPLNPFYNGQGDSYYYGLRYNFTNLSKSTAYNNYAMSVRLIKDI
jgi:hypothetical protein